MKIPNYCENGIHIQSKYLDMENVFNEKHLHEYRQRMYHATERLVTKGDNVTEHDCNNWMDLMNECLLIEPELLKCLRYLLMKSFKDDFWENEVISNTIINNLDFCNKLIHLGK